MKTQIFEITEQSNRTTSVFSRGGDILTMKIWRLIESKSRFEVWYIKDLEKKFKENAQKLRRALNSLEKQRLIKKIKAYPVFWEKI